MTSKIKLRMIPGDDINPWRFVLTSLDFVDAAYQFVAMNNWAEKEFGKSPIGSIDRSRWWVEHGYWNFARQEDAILVYLTWC